MRLYSHRPRVVFRGFLAHANAAEYNPSAHLGRGQPTSHRAYNGSLRDAKYSTEPTLSLRAPRRPPAEKRTHKPTLPASPALLTHSLQPVS
ncbi:hypothetical protein EYF80_055516 [Liparis tanakae]|uniref:Uncharacterized protein n=1 Tax=Liparis tanakae TaxID=230148 RepID=A0A4Z2F0B7_9TELE|nr:hypothetical protein EYF80_055516 [Liparis tanakae]